MSWFSDIFSGGTDRQIEAAEPAERVLQLRRGISAAAAALPEGVADTGTAAVDAADALADRVAELVETPGPGEDVEVESPAADVDAAGWLREGPARRREAGGPAGAEVADAGALPDEIAEEAADLLSDLHFSLLRIEIEGEEPASLSVSGTIEDVRELAGRLDDRTGAGGGGAHDGGAADDGGPGGGA